ncbi:C2H2 type zinc finger domain protein [Penicillium longicatenatum]|nr:C2H2 type zinc finger domain protein [Penicillium longicatenatum]
MLFSLLFMNADGGVNLDLEASISAADLALLKSLVRTCRRLGMFLYPTMLARYNEADLPLFVAVGIEKSNDSTVCAKLSSYSSEDRILLHASEPQFPLPGNDALLNAVERDEWEANGREEDAGSLKDDFHQRWISKHADVINFLGL